MRHSIQFRRPVIATIAFVVFSFFTTTVEASTPGLQSSPAAEAATDPATETPPPRAWPRSIERGDAVLILQRPQLDL